MRARLVLLRTGVVLSLLTLVHAATASADFAAALPNGDPASSLSCRYCHTVAPELNVFGVASDPYTPADLANLWPSLCALDSDGDTVSNGSEMGDPCCVWVINGPAPQEPVASNPGDPMDAVETVCDPNATGGTTGSSTGTSTGGGTTTGGTTTGGNSEGAGMAKPPPPVSTGACAARPPGSSRWGWLALAAGAAVLAVARRRRAPPR